MTKVKKQFSRILYAPNVHSGGGLVLLNRELDEHQNKYDFIFLSDRAKQKLAIENRSHIKWVGPSFFSRFLSEIRLSFLAKEGDEIFCFHGLPPLLKVHGNIKIFIQNRLLFENFNLRDFRLKTRIRIRIERLIIRLFHRRSILYLAQTPSMERSIRDTLGQDCNIKLIPLPKITKKNAIHVPLPRKLYDFLYVADGLPHKNILRLIEAWGILARNSVYPKLALTIDIKKFPEIEKILNETNAHSQIKIVNLGNVPQEQMQNIYLSSKALIYPSLCESLGLPLLEASKLGLPIVASELSYVFDVSKPVLTFDPYSPFCIAECVIKFIKENPA